ncbi:VOC family protein [Spiractinospora alimapuensis]|uniref:VOC family protein n=1 Tax=Spiractinospora alimapuensis TaxID=2820884 RepID=UPI001F389B70|nr:VOC family protein [Spiractinospora alimapuensis]
MQIADRPKAMAFYRAVFGVDPIGVPEEDGVPEPLRFQVNDQTSLTLIPPGGLGWVMGGREIAPTGVSESLLSLTLASEREVTELVGRFRDAGGDVLVEPQRQPWGFTSVCTDIDGHAWQMTTDDLPRE